jgi:hypothetical protein
MHRAFSILSHDPFSNVMHTVSSIQQLCKASFILPPVAITEMYKWWCVSSRIFFWLCTSLASGKMTLFIVI